MKLALVGISNSGRTTLFNGLTGHDAAMTCYAGSDAEPNVAVIKVPDRRIDELVKIFRPRKNTAEVISFDDFIKAGSLPAARAKGILRLEGKTYVVRDGDIIDFWFNV